MQVFSKHQIALAAISFLGAASAVAPTASMAAKVPGHYVAGDFHNHTTCSDGSISMQKLVKKVTEKTAGNWGLDWFVQAGHGGTGNRNCTLIEDASLATPAYPVVTNSSGAVQGPTTSWENSGVAIKGTNAGGTSPNKNMWRWQSIQELQYPVTEYLTALKGVPVFMGMESVVAGHEHSSMSVITGQLPTSLDTAVLPTTPGYVPQGNANALAQWSYCFDRGDTDTSRGGANNWDCSVTGSLNASNVNWNATAQKLTNNSGVNGHNKTLEALKWMAEKHGTGSYYVPAHLERAGPFNTAGSNGFNVEHLRNFNNTAPNVAFGFETQPGHGASSDRGEYKPLRNSFACTGALTNPGATTQTTNPDGSVCTVAVAANATAASSNGSALIDSVGGTTYGGTGVYGAQVGGVWDALLGEGRNFWFFASSDWHNRGGFGPDDRRSMQDFYPGEYQRNYTLVRNGSDKIRPQSIVDGLRTGNNWASSGQIIDRLAFVACASYPGTRGTRTSASVEALAVAAANGNTDIDVAGCATMGEKLKLNAGGNVIVSIVLRDPAGTNNSPYSFNNPSLAQVNIAQPLNTPVLDHVDVIRGLVTGYRTPGAADYSGAWPRNTSWLRADGTTAGLSAVPAAAKNTSAALLKTFSSNGASAWVPFTGADGTQMLKMTFTVPAVQASQYLRLRGTNLPASVPFETDASGNPLADIYTNSGTPNMLRIPCTATGTNVPTAAVTWTDANGTIDGCPAHLATANAAVNTATGLAVGTKMVSYDIAAWSDLWFYSNPIYVEVAGSTVVAGVK